MLHGTRQVRLQPCKKNHTEMSQTANKSMEHNYEIAEKSPQPPFEGNMMVREVIMV